MGDESFLEAMRVLKIATGKAEAAINARDPKAFGEAIDLLEAAIGRAAGTIDPLEAATGLEQAARVAPGDDDGD